ncbi:MAG: hypothetical protein M9962_11805 [Oligoflexia bacterium]|nr:hypothetical protein [Oligoflexia bacterium]
MLIASIAWYGSFGAEGLLITLFCVFIGFWLYNKLIYIDSQKDRKTLLLLFLLFVVFIFILFRVKYLSVPAGLSFLFFQLTAILIDQYRRPQKDPITYKDWYLFLYYFPQLMAGPIERRGNLLPQLKRGFSLNWENLSTSVLLFSWGFFKKVAVAGVSYRVAMAVSNTTSPGAAVLFFGSFLMAASVYADFSGYIDIGRGVSLFFGIRLTKSFKPFIFASSPADFWRRWHITLGTWFRDYIIKSMLKPNSFVYRRIIAILISFLLMGLWHGVAWNWFLFGLFNGITVILDLFYKRKKLPTIVTILGMTLFIATSGYLHLSGYFPNGIFDPIMSVQWTTDGLLELISYVFVPFLIFFIVEVWIEKRPNGLEDVPKFLAFILSIFFILSAFVSVDVEVQPFLYFNF